MQKQAKFAIASAVIVITLVWLGWIGATESRTYYYTVQELEQVGNTVAGRRLRVGGDIRAGSIERLRGRVDFVIEQEGRELAVSYVGSDPLPDTFVDGAQALVEGKRMPGGRFVAEKVQAKCASKYEAAPGGKPGYAAPEGQPQAAPAASDKKS